MMAVSIMNTLLLLILVANSTTTTMARILCTNLMPGLDLMLKGVDVTEIDMLPNDLQANDLFGYRQPVLEYTCNENASVFIEGTRYQRPDQIWHIENNPAGEIVSEVMIETDTQEIISNFNAGLDASGSYQGISLGFSASLKKTIKDRLHKSYIATETGAFKSATTVFLLPNWGLQIHREAQLDINRTLIDKHSKADYMQFIRKFGTHFFSMGKMGGYLKYITRLKSKKHATLKDMKVKLGTSVGFMDAVGFSFATTAQETEMNSIFTREWKRSIKFYGGNTKLINEKVGISEWQSTVSKNPWLISGDLTPIYEIIKDKTTRSIMKNYVDQYVLKAEVLKLKDLWNWADCKMWNFKYNETVYVEEEIKTITDDVEKCVVNAQFIKLSCSLIGMYSCDKGSTCYTESQKCNGTPDCKDNLDEKKCDNCYQTTPSSYDGKRSRSMYGNECVDWKDIKIRAGIISIARFLGLFGKLTAGLFYNRISYFESNYCRQFQYVPLPPWCFIEEEIDLWITSTSYYLPESCDLERCKSF